MLARSHLTRKAILKCQVADKSEFQNSTCSLSISVGQAYHEGDKFNATLITINENFKQCVFVIGDSLYRHTMKANSNLTEEELHQKANLLGDEWLERNLSAIEQLSIPFTITRWDSWLNHAKYAEAYNFINDLHINDIGFKVALENTALLFLSRKLAKSNNLTSEQTLLLASIDYLKEECAGMLLWADSGFQFEIYPNQRNEAMDYVYRNVICKYNPKLVQAISIKFKNLVPLYLSSQHSPSKLQPYRNTKISSTLQAAVV